MGMTNFEIKRAIYVMLQKIRAESKGWLEAQEILRGTINIIKVIEQVGPQVVCKRKKASVGKQTSRN